MDRVWGWLRDLPGVWQRLELAVVPGQGHGERVRSSSPGSKPAASVSAVSLRASSARVGQASFRRRRDWTPEGADLSIPEWVEGWVWAWRRRNGHHRPELVDAHSALEVGRPDAPERPDFYNERGELLPAEVIRARLQQWTAELAAWQLERDLIAAEGARVVLGVGPALAPADRPDDPLDERLQHRLGQRAQSFSLGANCGYLANWFDHAVDHPAQHPDHELAAFVGGLRDLTNRAKAILGEPGPAPLGRCVEPFWDRAADSEQPCGAPLFVDPQPPDPRNKDEPRVRVAVCRRCRTEYPSDRWLWLAARQREIWPKDAPTRQTWEAAS